MAPTTLLCSSRVKAGTLFALLALIATAIHAETDHQERFSIDNVNNTTDRNTPSSNLDVSDAPSDDYYTNTQVTQSPDVAVHTLQYDATEKPSDIGDSKLLPNTLHLRMSLENAHDTSTAKTDKVSRPDSSKYQLVNIMNGQRLITESVKDRTETLADIPVDSFPVKLKLNVAAIAEATTVDINITSYDGENATAEVYESDGAEFPQDNSVLSTVMIDYTNSTMISHTESAATDILAADNGITRDISTRLHLPDATTRIPSTSQDDSKPDTDTATAEYTTTAASTIELLLSTLDNKVTFPTPSLVGSVVIKSAGGVDIPWPVKKEAVVEGDLVIGGLMMVHEREDSVTCGPVMPQGGVQALEAMLFTLDTINAGLVPGLDLPNVTLGAHILDDCDKDTYGLEMAVDFIKGELFETFL